MKRIDWKEYDRACAERRDHSDDVFRIALERVSRGFKDCARDYPEYHERYSRMAEITHGIRLAGNVDDAREVLEEMEVKLTPEDEILFVVLNAIDTTNDIILAPPCAV